MTVPGGGFSGGNGQWARTRNQEGADSFRAEQEQNAAAHSDEYARSLAFRRRMRARILSWFRRTKG